MEVLSSRILVRPRDRDRSTAFYRDVLGLAVHREFPGGTVFVLGGGFLEVSGHSDNEHLDNEHLDNEHLDAGLHAGTAVWLQVRDLSATATELRHRGVEVLREPRREPWGLDEMWIADPDGLRLVLVEVPPEHPMRRDQRPGAEPPVPRPQQAGDGDGTS